ncbi:dephospho-CoA kinase [Hyphomicrobium sp.]|uniref:dephospho-CoA kinase n=1 Tax=Hyphomicrobium sp. TaxID=82 RepID=UPI002E350CB9|nr:dephospho-CoA kinase [Hyphomicrobium sp.]HEX2840672.1 dephospho-CoA kinase [Hyphomicrobium sp.]
MLIVGLTGSIGMGKSTVAGLLRARGVPVFDADAEVHRLYAAEAAPLIEKAFPGTTSAGQVDRARLAAALAKDEGQFRKLEEIVHPLVHDAEQRFLNDAQRSGTAVAVLEIPLLLEVGRNEHVDVVVVVSAPAHHQRARVLERPGMTDDRLDALLARQLPDAEKRLRADFVVDTGGTFADTEAQVDAILTALKSKPAHAFVRDWQLP